MARTRPVDDEGKPIDPNTQLENYLQKVAASSADAPETPVEPSYKTVTFDDVDDPELKGKTGQDALQLLADRKKAAEAERQRADAAEIELARARQQQMMDESARRAVESMTPRAPVPPPAPELTVEQRETQIDELWFTDPPAARKLLRELEADERKKEREQDRTSMTQAQGRERANWAYSVATAQLKAEGVPESNFNVDRMTAVYSAISRPPTPQAPNPYWVNGGPLNPQVIYQAYRDFFGGPAPAPVPPASVAPPAPAPPAPPGSSRPAPAATTPKAGTAHLSQQQKNEIDHMAKSFNLDPEKLAARRRARLERGDAHA